MYMCKVTSLIREIIPYWTEPRIRVCCWSPLKYRACQRSSERGSVSCICLTRVWSAPRTWTYSSEPQTFDSKALDQAPRTGSCSVDMMTQKHYSFTRHIPQHCLILESESWIRSCWFIFNNSLTTELYLQVYFNALVIRYCYYTNNLYRDLYGGRSK